MIRGEDLRPPEVVLREMGISDLDKLLNDGMLLCKAKFLSEPFQRLVGRGKRFSSGADLAKYLETSRATADRLRNGVKLRDGIPQILRVPMGAIENHLRRVGTSYDDARPTAQLALCHGIKLLINRMWNVRNGTFDERIEPYISEKEIPDIMRLVSVLHASELTTESKQTFSILARCVLNDRDNRLPLAAIDLWEIESRLCECFVFRMASTSEEVADGEDGALAAQARFLMVGAKRIQELLAGFRFHRNPADVAKFLAIPLDDLRDRIRELGLAESDFLPVKQTVRGLVEKSEIVLPALRTVLGATHPSAAEALSDGGK